MSTESKAETSVSREDHHSTDLEGAKHYARIYSDGFDLVDDRPTRRELMAEDDPVFRHEAFDQIEVKEEVDDEFR